MNYRVWLTTPKPIVIDDHGNEIANAYVHEIKFPPAAIHTANGTVWVIGGPGVALISVDGIYYADVPCVSTP